MKNTHTNKQKKKWEKRLNENYFKLFRKKKERTEVESKRSRKQERKSKHRKNVSARPIAYFDTAKGSVASVTWILRMGRGTRRKMRERSKCVDKGKR